MSLISLLRAENLSLRQALWLKGEEVDDLRDQLATAEATAEASANALARKRSVDLGLGEKIERLERRTEGLERRVVELCRRWVGEWEGWVEGVVEGGGGDEEG
ncbi:hypothetical protein MMC16_004533 [Acarospora aff. strigata]|nr:hypothetical protein [Acarospora aff. strigata]